MGLFSKKRRDDDEPDEEEGEELEREMVLFQGATEGRDVDLKANARLVQAALVKTKELVSDALNRRAGVLHLEPKPNMTAAYFVIDGVRYPAARFPSQQGLAITQMIKLLAGLDIKDRKSPQQGGINAQLEKTKYLLKVSSTPVKGGERLLLTAQDVKHDPALPANLGFPEDFKTRIRQAADDNRGFVLVTGPPGSGVTTMLHGVLRSVDSYMSSVYSVATPGEHDLINVTDFEAAEGDDLDKTVTRVQRSEADIVFVDPIGSIWSEEKDLAFWLKWQDEMAVITEFAAKDSATGLLQLMKWAGGVDPIVNSVRAIASGKLIRLLCDKCKQVFKPNPRFLVKVGLPPETQQLFREFTPPVNEEGEEEEFAICKKCGGIGYYGQQPLLELLEMTDEMKQLVSGDQDPKKIRALMKKAEMYTHQQDGLRLVAEGKTSLEELKRVFSGR